MCMYCRINLGACKEFVAHIAYCYVFSWTIPINCCQEFLENWCAWYLFKFPGFVVPGDFFFARLWGGCGIVGGWTAIWSIPPPPPHPPRTSPNIFLLYQWNEARGISYPLLLSLLLLCTDQIEALPKRNEKEKKHKGHLLLFLFQALAGLWRSWCTLDHKFVPLAMKSYNNIVTPQKNRRDVSDMSSLFLLL